MVKIIFSIDLEPDITKYLKSSYQGVCNGIPRLLNQFELFDVKADFFATADVCLKYPGIMKQIIDPGHRIGCHSYDHSIAYLGKENFKKQLNDISAATQTIKRTTGCAPTLFRAPNFSINGDTVRILEELGYTIDSSILPGRKVKKWRIFTLINYTNANTGIYNPSYSDVRISGDSNLIEVPLTENPLAKGSPMGLGYLNAYGLEKTIEAINNINSDYITFLIHPWEAVDLGKYYPKLRPWLHSACSSDMAKFHEFLENITKRYEISTIEEIVRTHYTQFNNMDAKI